MFREIGSMVPKRKRITSNDDDDAAGPSAGCFTCNFCLHVKQLLGRRHSASCAHDRVVSLVSSPNLAYKHLFRRQNGRLRPSSINERDDFVVFHSTTKCQRERII